MEEYEWVIDEKHKDAYLEIGTILTEINILSEYLEDLREAIACKPVQWQRFLSTVQKQANEVYERTTNLLRFLRKDIQGDQQ